MAINGVPGRPGRIAPARPTNMMMRVRMKAVISVVVMVVVGAGFYVRRWEREMGRAEIAFGKGLRNALRFGI
jgi:hypothetical protein